MDSAGQRRQYETQRKREYRALKRKQAKHLRHEILFLEDHLQQLLHAKVATQKHSVHNQWNNVSLTQNRSLRAHVRYHDAIVLVLQAWVASSLQRSIDGTTTWLDSTLLADPVARQYGYQWLTDRVFHTAEMDGHQSSTVDDAMDLRVVVDDDDVDSVGIYATFQCTLFAPLDQIAAFFWQNQSSMLDRRFPDHLTHTRSCNDDLLVYAHTYAGQSNTNMCTLARRYNLPGRVILVNVFVRDDECVPLSGQDIRPHGIGYRILQQIADDVTLMRCGVQQCTPVTVDGRIPFERTAARFGVPPSTPRQVALAQIEAKGLEFFSGQETAVRAKMMQQLQRH
ncbi:Aste57867_12913 [Aphanomyces stellatus]|uniref:Aste57867_12913 protein n=1 Tax=Aphanomyces stellatus TaxID=120398 RepID=A0A485KWU7_9STRA|nr:hypothetical protein As57867_012865 [Aphanomyces stellatus]VFT89759.1 Aste57867_12913 [Aphanomyces stellatus]